MKSFIVLLAVLASSVVFTGCSSVSPIEGHEAVLVKHPLLFGHGGVDPETIKTGRTFVALTTDERMVDMRPILKKIHLEDMMTKDRVPLDFDATMRMQTVDSYVLIRDYGSFDRFYDINIDKVFQNAARQEIRQHTMNETALSSEAIDVIDKNITTFLMKYIKDEKFPVILKDITVGKANPPDDIKQQCVETAAQQQRIETEKQRKLAEDQREMAEKARAVADNAYRESMQMSPSQFLQLEQIKAMKQMCGNQNCTMIVGGAGGGVTPVLNVK